MNPEVTILMNDEKKIVLELYKDAAPNTVKNFISLIRKGFYDGLIFHRVIANFMIQGGCPDGEGTGGPDYSIAGEFKTNKFENPTKHGRGTISMARSMDPDSAGSQFFIVHKDAPHLDGSYAAFGKVIDGMSVVDEIAAQQTDARDKPIEAQVIEKIEVDLKDGNYKEPKVKYKDPKKE